MICFGMMEREGCGGLRNKKPKNLFEQNSNGQGKQVNKPKENVNIYQLIQRAHMMMIGLMM